MPMVTVSFFYRLSRRERIPCFERIGGRGALPSILYDTACPAGQLDIDDMEAIASATPNSVGVKEGNPLQPSDAVRRLSPQVGIHTSRDTCIREPGAAGGGGAVTYPTNVAPQLTVDLWKAMAAGDHTASFALQHRLNPLAWGLVVTSFPRAVKAAMNRLGWPVGTVRTPLLDLDAGQIADLDAILASLPPQAR